MYSALKCWENSFTNYALPIRHLALRQSHFCHWSPIFVNMGRSNLRIYPDTIRHQQDRLIADTSALKKLPVSKTSVRQHLALLRGVMACLAVCEAGEQILDSIHHPLCLASPCFPWEDMTNRFHPDPSKSFHINDLERWVLKRAALHRLSSHFPARCWLLGKQTLKQGTQLMKSPHA